MTRKHYEAIARALRELEPPIEETRWNDWWACVQRISNALKADNAKFSADRFASACYKFNRAA